MGARESVLHGLHLLVVEKDRDAREILAPLLTYFGAFVTVAGSTPVALRLLGAYRPDVVVADMTFGKSDAVSLLAQARKVRNVAPFIIVSTEDLDETTCSASGSYLRKPVDHKTLVDTILAVIRQR